MKVKSVCILVLLLAGVLFGASLFLRVRGPDYDEVLVPDREVDVDSLRSPVVRLDMATGVPVAPETQRASSIAADADVSDVAIEDGATDGVLELEPTHLAAGSDLAAERFPAARLANLVKLPSIPVLLDQNPGSFSGLKLPIPGGEFVDVDILRQEMSSRDRGLIMGKVVGNPLSEVIVTYYKRAITASVIAPGIGHFEIAYAGNGEHFLLEIDPERLLPNGFPLLPVYE